MQLRLCLCRNTSWVPKDQARTDKLADNKNPLSRLIEHHEFLRTLSAHPGTKQTPAAHEQASKQFDKSSDGPKQHKVVQVWLPNKQLAWIATGLILASSIRALASISFFLALEMLLL